LPVEKVFRYFAAGDLNNYANWFSQSSHSEQFSHRASSSKNI